MSSSRALSQGLHYVADSAAQGLAVAEKRVKDPLATVICIHGGLDRGGSFARLARRTTHLDLVAYDRRGYQGSRDRGPIEFENHLDDLISLARREAVKGPVLYFGHSFGGVVAFGAALREPSLTQQVIVYETPLPWVRYREGSRATLSANPEEEAELFFRRMVSNGAWERLSEFEQQSRRLDGPALYSDMALFRSGAKPFDLSQLEVPSLYTHGDTYHIEYYRALCRDLHALNPIITSRELNKAGHGAHLSHPDHLADLILDTWAQRCASQ